MLHILSKESTMKISELSDIFNTSMMTIRRDLDYLEQNGIVTRFHGGARLTKTDGVQPSFYERFEEFSNEKYQIGKEAAKLIKPGSIVFFDAGTTCLAIVEHIPEELNFTAITTGLITSVALCSKPNASIISVGGDIHNTSYSSVNHIAVNQITRFHANLCFISTKSVVVPDGTYEAVLPLIEVKEAIVKSSEHTVLLADSSKFENKSMCKAIPFSSIDTVISDGKLPEKYASQVRALGVELILTKE